MINKTSTGEKIFFIFLSAAIAVIVSLTFYSIFDTKAKREKREAIIYLNSIIQERDQTIKVLRDNLALDSVLVISKEIKIRGLQLYDDTRVDTIIVDYGSDRRVDRQWKRK